MLLSFKKHDSVWYLAQLMLALQCSYVERSHKYPECISKEGEFESLRKHIFVSQVIKNMDFKINFIFIGTWGLGRLFFYPLKSTNLYVIWVS